MNLQNLTMFSFVKTEKNVYDKASFVVGPVGES